MRPLKNRFFLAMLGALCLAPLPALADQASTRDALLEKGLDQWKLGHYWKAEESFKSAIDAETEPCGECQLGLALVYSRIDEWKKGEAAARSAAALLEGTGREHLAHHELGTICLGRAEKRASYLECAEKAFRAAVEKGGSAESEYHLGSTLLRRSKEKEGLEVLRRYLDEHPTHRHAEKARGLLERPLAANKNLIPPFDWRTLRGKSVSSSDAAGKVVLLDFWATWCKPCINAVPTLRDIAEEHEDDPFLLISVSIDRNESKIRDFIRDHSMHWPQVWDTERWGASKLGIQRYPTYILVGPDGEILERFTGGGGGVERKLGRAVKRAVRAAKKAG